MKTALIENPVEQHKETGTLTADTQRKSKMTRDKGRANER
ncbi:hypothetical protein STRDD11_00673 [Streptococcus sp. DD11]|nr:hypothetical protein STRDD11_00673 [Streptococcus sp. DD11]